MAHRDPASPLWSLAARSKQLWHHLVDSDPAWRTAIEWQVIYWNDHQEDLLPGQSCKL